MIKLHPDVDLQVSRLVYGTWRLLDQDPKPTKEQVLDRIKLCLDLGITTFDLADIYGGGGHQCEKAFGDALALEPALRERMQLVTKCDIRFPNDSAPDVYVKHYDTSKEYIVKQVQESLKAVGVEYFDLLLIHRPDPFVDADEVAEAFKELKGVVRHFGVSNFNRSQFQLLQSRLHKPLITNQIEASCVKVDPYFDGTMDFCQEFRVAPMIWSPLAGGVLFKGSSSPQIDRLKGCLKKLSLKYNVSVDTLMLSWLLAHPSRSVVVLGTNSMDRIKSQAKALEVKLSRQDWFQILEASRGHEVA